MQALVESISHALQSCGWHVDVNNNVLEARRDAIKASWWFGSRRVRSSLRCVFDEKNTVLSMSSNTHPRIPLMDGHFFNTPHLIAKTVQPPLQLG